MSKPAYNPNLKCNRRSPPVSNSEAGMTDYSIPGMMRGEVSAQQESLFLNHSQHPGYSPRDASPTIRTVLNVQEERNQQCAQR